MNGKEGFWRTHLLRPQLPPEDGLREAIREVCGQLEAARQRFDAAGDGDLIEANIYEMEALQARYRYLLKRARDGGVTAAPAPLWDTGYAG